MRFGPNTPQVERYLDLLSGVTREQWHLLLELKAERGDHEPAPDEPSAASRALAAAQDVCEDAGLTGLFRAVDAAYVAARDAVAGAPKFVAVYGGNQEVWPAAQALVLRPWISEPLFRAAYGLMAQIIRIDDLGEPPSPSPRRVGPPRPRERLQFSLEEAVHPLRDDPGAG